MKGSLVGAPHDRTLLTYALTKHKLSTACVKAVIECERVGSEVEDSRGLSPATLAAGVGRVEYLQLLRHSRGVDMEKHFARTIHYTSSFLNIFRRNIF